MTRILEIGVSLAISIIILLSTFFYIIDVDWFYSYEIEKNNISAAAHIPEDELLPLYKTLTDYMVDKREDIQIQATVDGTVMPMYNAREIAHMVDVKWLTMAVKQLRNILLLLAALGLFFIVRKKRDFENVFLGQVISTLAVFAGFIGMATSDFNKYFIKFHEMFFTNDLWLLNPNTDRMIQLLPEVFFRDMVIVIVVGYGFVSFILAVLGVAINRRLFR